MIITNLSTLKDTLPKIWHYVAIALKAYKCGAMNRGKQTIDGDSVYFVVSGDNLEPEDNRRLEIHRKFADVQMVLSGKERYGYLIGKYNGPLEEEHFDVDDLAFINKDKQCQYLELAENELVIFLPGEAHKPLCRPSTGNQEVHKAIIKIDKELIPELISK